MSVFELASLPKLRRIGLVRVNNLTDEAIYTLADREATLERIHLSYCDQITVLAIHFLLQKLKKLTHLSLTGIPAFRKPEYQAYCRSPPPEFNMSQRAAFCVYSGKGIAELRTFLTTKFHNTDLSAADDTEFEDDEDQEDRGITPEGDLETGNEGDDDEDHSNLRQYPHPSLAMHRGNWPPNTPASPPSLHNVPSPTQREPRAIVPTIPPVQSSLVAPTPQLPAVNLSIPSGSARVNGHNPAGPSNLRPRPRVFGQQPVVETSSSPTPSDPASNRSTGTNQSNGAGFFRTYHEVASSPRSNGALTPDLNFAEIGHGRGSYRHSLPGSGTSLLTQSLARQSLDTNGGPDAGPSSSPHSISQVIRSREYPAVHNRTHVLSDSSNYHLPGGRASPSESWPLRPSTSPSPSTSPTTRELHASVQSALGSSADGREAEGRGRTVKRSLRNTLHAAEHFLFGRGSQGVLHEGSSNGSTANGTDNGARGH